MVKKIYPKYYNQTSSLMDNATMSNDNIFIFGSSGHSKVIIDIIEKTQQFQIMGLIDLPSLLGKQVFQHQVIGTEKKLLNLIKSYNTTKGIIAIGDNFLRKKIAHKITTIFPDFDFINAIHPSAQIGKNVTLGKGTSIMANAIINADSKIQDHCIINTAALIEHDNELQSFCSIAPRVTTGGNVKIGKLTTIYLGAILVPNICIGNCSVIGAGSLVLKNIPSQTLHYGFPAKERKKIIPPFDFELFQNIDNIP